MRHPVQKPYKSDFNVMEPGFQWLNEVSRYSVDIRTVDVTIDPDSVAANTSGAQNVTVPGLKVGDLILKVAKPTHTAGFLVGNAFMSAADTLTVQFINVSTGPIDAGSETYTVVYIKNTAV